MPQSPEFKLEAFRQDIENLTRTLDHLGLKYGLVKKPIEVKVEGQPFRREFIEIPTFVMEQFLGRLCMVIEDLQLANMTPENDGLIARCSTHGTEAENGKFIYFEGRAFCLVCLCEQAGCEAGWATPYLDEEERNDV